MGYLLINRKVYLPPLIISICKFIISSLLLIRTLNSNGGHKQKGGDP